MEEYFAHKCVTADASAPQSSSSSISAWTTSRRCEFVVVQENQQAHGASRAVLAAIANMEAMALTSTITASPKLTHIDFSGDTSLFEDQLAELNGDISSTKSSSLLAKVQQRVDNTLAKIAAKPQDSPGLSARPVVVIVDSLNVIFQQNALQTVLLWLRRLRQQPLIGSLIVRYNAGGGEPVATRHVLGSESTAVALVETPSSLLAYPILAKERRREIPKDMHGLVLLLRQKKNGRSSESVDYFQIVGHEMQFFPAGQHSTDTKQSEPKAVASNDTQRPSSKGEKHETLQAAPSQMHQQAALPVRQEDVSFNLSISVEEQLAKRSVQLPYMHQGQQPATGSNAATNSTSSSSNNHLFFIDEDDPDWDDDDLDDDLDI
uniref:Elongator complex protein 5 n=1 Tax=Globisporangium ultimum (strain ATCC 200006 / CBS 805.95 / DAOM BR144) TaxID=431595 RepID=K3X809_GLOUD